MSVYAVFSVLIRLSLSHAPKQFPQPEISLLSHFCMHNKVPLLRPTPSQIHISARSHPSYLWTFVDFYLGLSQNLVALSVVLFFSISPSLKGMLRTMVVLVSSPLYHSRFPVNTTHFIPQDDDVMPPL